jgi:nitroreductase
MQDVLTRYEDAVHPAVPADRRAATTEGFRRMWGDRPAAEREQWGAGQGYIALGYLLLAAASYGYGTSPMLGFDPNRVKQALGLPAHAAVPAMVAIGRPDEEGFAHHRHPLERIVTWR